MAHKEETLILDASAHTLQLDVYLGPVRNATQPIFQNSNTSSLRESSFKYQIRYSHIFKTEHVHIKYLNSVKFKR